MANNVHNRCLLLCWFREWGKCLSCRCNHGMATVSYTLYWLGRNALGGVAMANGCVKGLYFKQEVQHSWCLQHCFYECAYSLWIKIYMYIKCKVQTFNVGKTASMTEYAYSLWIKIYIEGKVQHWLCWQNCFYRYMRLFESRYTFKGTLNVGKTASMTAYSLWLKIYIEGKVQHW